LQKYDIICAGGGLSALTAVLEMVQNPYFLCKSILILDKSAKNQNDRTWCFWEEPQDYDLTPLRTRTWERMVFQAKMTGHKKLDTGQYRYAMLRSAEFYAWAYEQLAAYPNVGRQQATINQLDAETGVVHTTVGSFQANWILNSAFMQHPLAPNSDTQLGWDAIFAGGEKIKDTPLNNTTYLYQHFAGWFIKTKSPAFDQNEIVLMDYRTPQNNDTRFVYVLPMSDHEALVEFTVFSGSLLKDKDAYSQALHGYITDCLKITDFEIIEKEFGVIPMSDFTPVASQGRILHIGTHGGTVKASSGYGFKTTRSRMKNWVHEWAATGKPNMDLLRSPFKYRWYDRILLSVLQHNYLPGERVFGYQFKNLAAHQIFRFLDEKTHFGQDLRFMLSVPAWPFVKGLWVKIFG
jgi:lycopene beta-cyclase